MSTTTRPASSVPARREAVGCALAAFLFALALLGR